MFAGELAKTLGLELMREEMAQWEMTVQGCYIGDLLSNVMGFARSGQLWYTVMTNINVVAVAHLAELAGVVFLEGHQPDESVIERALLESIPLFQTTLPAYESALVFDKAGLEQAGFERT